MAVAERTLSDYFAKRQGLQSRRFCQNCVSDQIQVPHDQFLLHNLFSIHDYLAKFEHLQLSSLAPFRPKYTSSHDHHAQKSPGGRSHPPRACQSAGREQLRSQICFGQNRARAYSTQYIFVYLSIHLILASQILQMHL